MLEKNTRTFNHAIFFITVLNKKILINVIIFPFYTYLLKITSSPFFLHILKKYVYIMIYNLLPDTNYFNVKMKIFEM